ncbi:MAG: hypothetical protein CVU48_02800 [Candidatus Cloacimonetes bacterium HGW-Cloacimonetes-1]|nr:MAG: hypothetical protein CVU48_02800 [Candidatus Cloacimonetes bacterium HGW-Cloacimonetes-1]
MKRLHWLLIILVLVCSSTLAAEDSNEARGLGMHFGTVSGNGYSYRVFQNDLGFQLTFGAYQYGNNTPSFLDTYYSSNGGTTQTVVKNGKKTLGSFGVNALSVLTKTEVSRFYLQFGFSYLVDRTDKYTQVYANTPNKGTYFKQGDKIHTVKNDDEWTIGIGPGLEMSGNNNLRLAIELPITYNQSKELIMYIPQIGLYYYFK